MSGRIIIIGNGFDLAHGLKTSYKDLMEFLKEETNPQAKESDPFNPYSTIPYMFNGKPSPYVCFKAVGTDCGIDYPFTTSEKHISFYFEKLFSDYDKYDKWVDLETLYFELISSNDNISKDFVKTLNDEFDHLKELLGNYLIHQVENKIPEVFEGDCNSYLFQKENNIFKTEDAYKEKIIGIINFNYTSKIVLNYITFMPDQDKQLHSNFIYINVHGKLGDKSNTIIFGYGDDNSDEYKSIQNKGNNELLKNFKTFQYLRNTNYKNALSLLELDDDIKIEIIGHSCGLSDKTLLKTIFEHPNVKKIEYRYHEEEKYYFENLYNISRIFSDNAMMRDKVMDLGSTREIPQRLLGIA